MTSETRPATASLVQWGPGLLLLALVLVACSGSESVSDTDTSGSTPDSTADDVSDADGSAADVSDAPSSDDVSTTGDSLPDSAEATRTDSSTDGDTGSDTDTPSDGGGTSDGEIPSDSDGTGDTGEPPVDPCLELDCAAEGRVCEQTGSTAECGTCLPSRDEAEDRCVARRGCTIGDADCTVDVIPIFGAHASINSAVASPDDLFYIVGRFPFLVRPDTIDGMARHGATGEWRTGWPGIDGRVMALAPDGEGGVFLGGDFASVGGEPRVNLAQVDRTGQVTSWAPEVDGWNSTAFDPSNVEQLFVHNDTVLVTGRFNQARGAGEDAVTQRALVAFDREGQLLDWAPDFDVPMLGPDLHFAATESMLLVGGRFTAVDGEERMGLAAFDDDHVLLDWAPNARRLDDAPAIIRALATAGSRIFIGGEFLEVNGEPRTQIAALDPEGDVSSWNPPVSGSVDAMVVRDDVLYVGGRLSVQGDSMHLRLVGVAVEDGSLTGFDVRIGSNVGGELRGLMATPEGLVAVGSLLVPGDGSRAALRVSWEDGSVDNWAPHVDGSIHAVAPVGENDVALAGAFSAAETIPHPYVASITPEGTVTGFRVDVDGAYVDGVAVHEETVLLGGAFTGLGDEPRLRIGSVTGDGTPTDWAPTLVRPNPEQVARSVASLAVHGDLVAAAVIGPQSDWTYETVQVFSAETGELEWSAVSRGVRTVLATETRLFVAGPFDRFGFDRRDAVAAFAWDGTLLDWSTTFPDEQVTGAPVVHHLAWLDDRLFIAGPFTRVDDEPRPGFAALDEDAEVTAVGADLDWNAVDAMSGGDTYVFIGRADAPEDEPALLALEPDGTPTGWSAPASRVEQLFWLSNRILALGTFDLPDGGTYTGWALLVPSP